MIRTRFAHAVLSGGFLAIAIVALSPTPASAAAAGPLNEANCLGGGVTVSNSSIVWSPNGTVSGTGCIGTGLGTDVTYSGGTLGPGVVGNIQNLTPGGGAVDQFMTFQGTTLDFVLTGFVAPNPTNGVNCASTTSGQSCVVFAGSPFLLVNAGGGSTSVTLGAFGTVTDGGSTSDWSGAFTTQLNKTPAQIQTIIDGNGSISSTQSAQFDVEVVTPEPVSYTLIGGGLIALAMAAKNRKKRS